MDVRGWPLDRIMQLPDHCFGRRFVVSVHLVSITGVVGWDISEIALPERCVLWELVYFIGEDSANFYYVRLALGDQLPTTIAMMDALEPCFMGLGTQGAEPRKIQVKNSQSWAIRMLRQPIISMGRRLVGEVAAVGAETIYANVALVVSSIPTEVPDCLLSVHP